jgi:aarF domain-containing kinase
VSVVERMARFTSLGFGIAMGTVGSLVSNTVRGTLQSSGGLKGSVLSEANSERLTLVLCRMRGAALKFGQLLSIQDEHVIPKDSPLRVLIDRVREEAEQMPPEQLHKQLHAQLGPDWRARMASFDDVPLATASVGQVHCGVTQDGMPVAIKIQYPGVADSIDSDISILGTLLAPLAPRGLFLPTALAELRVAMKDETDYRLAHPKPETRNPKPETRNLQPEARSPRP